MRPTWLRRLLPALAVVVLASPAYAQRPPAPPAPFLPGSWWRDFQKQLGLSMDQSNRIDGVFQAALPKLREKRNELESAEAELSKLIESDVDEVSIMRQSDRVETLRAAM